MTIASPGVPAPEMDPEPVRSHRADAWARLGLRLGATPFFLFVGVFLLIPVTVNIWTSLHDAEGNLTFATLAQLTEKQYASAFVNTAWLSAVTTVLGGVLGLVIAWALATIEHPRWLKSLMLSFTVVASQQGGIPLAYAFVATLGTQGMVTVIFRERVGIELTDFVGLSTFNGLVVVYLYFQATLMAVLMLPAVLGIRKEWRESATSLGAGSLRYLKDVILPILAPSIGGSALLLFANAFAAYATAYALAGSGANLVPILIGFFISGNVLSDPTMGAALVTGMIAVIGVAMIGRWALLRRTTRWLR